MIYSPLALTVRVERWPIAGSFAISRGAKTEAVVVVAELSDGDDIGRGECVPYARYGETVEGVAGGDRGESRATSRAASTARRCSTRCRRARRATRSTARSGISSAKRAGRPLHELLGLPAPEPVTTAYTISLATPDEMAHAAAKAAAPRPLLKIKLGGAGRPGAHRRRAPRRAAMRN